MLFSEVWPIHPPKSLLMIRITHGFYGLSARSSDLLWNGEVSVMRTTKSPAYPVGELIRTEQPVELHDPPFAVNPLGLYSVKPRTLFRQKATHDPHPGLASTLVDLPVVLSEPPEGLLWRHAKRRSPR